MNSLQSFLAVAPVNPVAAAARLPSSRRTRVSAYLAAPVPVPPAGQPASFSVFIWVKCTFICFLYFTGTMMRPSKTNGSVQKAGRANHAQGEGPSWVLVAGRVLLSTLSVRFGCKLKRMFDTKKQKSTSRAKRRHGSCELHSNLYRIDDETNCYCCVSDGGEEIKQGHANSLSKPDELSLPLAKISGPESSKENSGIMWTSSPDRLEDHHRPLQYSNSSGSPCVSELGSDIYIERKVIQKLRQHLKRRDEMIMEM